MNKDLLTKYFAKKCTDEETKMVEEWLLDTNNQSQLDNFLEEKWDNHAQNYPKTLSKKTQTISILAKVAAVILVLGATYLYINNSSEIIPIQSEKTAKNELLDPIKLQDTIDKIAHLENSEDFSLAKKKKTTSRIKENPTITKDRMPNDSIAQHGIASKGVKASKLAHFKINEVALAKFKDKIDSNTMILNVDLNNASFERLAGLLYKEYGIIIEPCSASMTTKTYTAKFEKVSVKDLLADMSNQLAFTFTMKDNIISICFN